MTLQEILKANGATDEQAKAILASMKENKIFTAGEENLDIRYGKLKGDFDNLTAQHGESTKLIEELQKGTKGNEELQGKITAYETQVTQLQEQLKKTQLESEIKVALLSAKATDVDYMTYRLNEKGDLELGKDGKIKGIDDKIAGLKTQFPTFFGTGTGNDGKIIEPNPLPDDHRKDSWTKEEILKKPYAERNKIFEENPEAYKNAMNS